MTSPSNFLAALGELSNNVSGFLYFNSSSGTFSTTSGTLPMSSVSGLSSTYAPINSPTFTGIPTNTNIISTADNSQALATTAFVQSLIASVLSSAVPTGTITAFAGKITPSGWALCGSTQTVVNIPTVGSSLYPLFQVIGNTWGGNGTTTWAMPYFPAGYTPIAGVSTSVGTSSVGQVIAHTHSLPNVYYASNPWGGAGTGGLGQVATTTGSTGGSANLAAGMVTSFIVKL